MKYTWSVSVLLLALVLVAGCYYDVEEELYPTLECDTENMSYTNDVLPIVQGNCYTCHDQGSNFGGVILEGYESLKTYVDNGRLLGAIRHESGFSPMPKNAPQLVACNIEKIEAWINAGAPDN
ncbi:MAG: hypothetical protein MI974_07995 [Chitinophagales bacterium]|nr:hypothetical protein [Chitinophagales bacterium]